MFDPDFTEAARALLEACRARGLRVATGESCTGGLIAAALTAIPGSSDVFERGFVTYSNEAKCEMLGVPAALIERCGAVSAEVAHAMAEGALTHSRADIAVAVTGVAGPGGGSEAKPVGLVHIVATRRGGARLHEECRFGDVAREAVREASARKALEMMARVIGPDKLLGLTHATHNILLTCLEELSDRSVQEKLWLGKSPRLMSSFTEAICGVFDDSGFGVALDSPSPRRRPLISEEVRACANELDRNIRAVPSYLGPEEIIAHPAMEGVRLAARNLLNLVR